MAFFSKKKSAADLPEQPNQISSDKLLNFVQQLCKLEELEVIGLVNLMGIQLVDLEKNPRNFEDILSDMIDQYLMMNRERRKKIDYVLNEVINGKDDGANPKKQRKQRKQKRKK